LAALARGVPGRPSARVTRPGGLERLLREWYPNAVGATAEEISAAEERIGRPLPEELKALYRVTRGARSSGEPIDAPGAPDGVHDLMSDFLLPVDEAYLRDSTYNMPSWSLAVMEAPRTPPGAAVQQLPGSPGWIVFASDYAASFFAVDLTPGATGHVGALDYDEYTGARLEARSLTDFVGQTASEEGASSRDRSAVAWINDRSLTSIESAAHPDLEALTIGVWEGEPVSLAPLIGLPRLRALTAYAGTLANPLEIASLTHLEYLAVGVDDWRALLDADAVPPNLLAANMEGSLNPLLDPPAGSAIYIELANDIAARWGRIDRRTTLIEGDLP
jgi:cell wall assembly regulator SMI1